MISVRHNSVTFKSGSYITGAVFVVLSTNGTPQAPHELVDMFWRSWVQSPRDVVLTYLEVADIMWYVDYALDNADRMYAHVRSKKRGRGPWVAPDVVEAAKHVRKRMLAASLTDDRQRLRLCVPEDIGDAYLMSGSKADWIETCRELMDDHDYDRRRAPVLRGKTSYYGHYDDGLPW